MSPVIRSSLVLAIASGTVACDRLEGNGAIVNVFATHHASPEDGVFPLRGEDDQPRIFEGENGWTITLAESYITISSVTLVSCAGARHDLQMYWGPCPEDLRTEDLATLTVAGLKVPPGDYCNLEIEYAPYEMPVIDRDADTRHEVPENEEVEDATIFLGGVARKGEDSVPFVLINSAELTVDLELASEDGPGQPMRVKASEDFPKELTVSKTYDRFFDGVDFSTFDEAAIEARLDDVLEDQTRVASGTVIEPEAFE